MRQRERAKIRRGCLVEKPSETSSASGAVLGSFSFALLRVRMTPQIKIKDCRQSELRIEIQTCNQSRSITASQNHCKSKSPRIKSNLQSSENYLTGCGAAWAACGWALLGMLASTG